MKFARRAKGAAAARQVFLSAKRSDQITYHVFVASGTPHIPSRPATLSVLSYAPAALTEFYLNKDPKVARNIFELGLKIYSNEPAFIRQCMCIRDALMYSASTDAPLDATFLMHLNEENSAFRPPSVSRLTRARPPGAV